MYWQSPYFNVAIAALAVAVYLAFAYFRNSTVKSRLIAVGMLAAGTLILIVRGIISDTTTVGIANSVSLCSVIVVIATGGDPTLLFDPDDWDADESNSTKEERIRLAKIGRSQLLFLGMVIGFVAIYVWADWTFLD